MGGCFSAEQKANKKLVQYEKTAVNREREIKKLRMEKRKLKSLLMCHCKNNHENTFVRLDSCGHKICRKCKRLPDMGECPFCIVNENGPRLKFDREVSISCFAFPKRAINHPVSAGTRTQPNAPSLKQAGPRPPIPSRATRIQEEKPVPSAPKQVPMPTDRCWGPPPSKPNRIVREFPLSQNDPATPMPTIPSIEEEENM